MAARLLPKAYVTRSDKKALADVSQAIKMRARFATRVSLELQRLRPPLYLHGEGVIPIRNEQVHTTIACEAHAINHKLKTTAHNPQTTNHKPQTTNHKPQTTNHKPQTTHPKLATLC
jgi:hypothetical protein